METLEKIGLEKIDPYFQGWTFTDRIEKKESGMGVKQLFVSYKVPIFFEEKIAKREVYNFGNAYKQ